MPTQSINTDVSQLNKDNQWTKTEADALADFATETKSVVNNNKTELDTVAGRVTAAEGKITTAETNITNLTGRVTTLENDGFANASNSVYRIWTQENGIPARVSGYVNTFIVPSSLEADARALMQEYDMIILTADLPEAPTGLAVNMSGPNARLTWTYGDDEITGFSIERKVTSEADSTYTEIATIGADLRQYDNESPTSGVGFSYRLRAYNAGRYSAYTSVVTIVIPETADTYFDVFTDNFTQAQLVCLLKFNASTGTTELDHSGNSNDFTYVQDSGFTPVLQQAGLETSDDAFCARTMFGSANGDRHIKRTFASPISANRNFSLHWSQKHTATFGDRKFISLQNTTNDKRIQIGTVTASPNSDSRITVRGAGVTTFDQEASGYPVDNGATHTYDVVYDRSESVFKYYIDNVLRFSQAYDMPTDFTFNEIMIGKEQLGGGTPFEGPAITAFFDSLAVTIDKEVDSALVTTIQNGRQNA